MRITVGIMMILLCSISKSFMAWAQPHGVSSYADSLRGILLDADDFQKVKIYSQLADYYKVHNIKTAYEYAQRGYDLAYKLEYAKGMAVSLIRIGEYRIDEGEYKLAIQIFEEALKKFQLIEEEDGVEECMSKIGTVYYFMSDYNNALSYLFRALDIARKINNEKEIATIYNAISYVYFRQGWKDKALEYRLTALKIRETLDDKEEVAKSHNAIGDFYFSQSSLSKALEHYHEAHKISKETENLRGISIALNNIGMINFRLNNSEKALDYMRQSLRLKEQVGNKREIAICYENMGSIYTNRQEFREALEWLQKALDIRKSMHERYSEAVCMNHLAHTYSAMEDFEKAIRIYQEVIQIAEEIKAPWLLAATYEALAQTYMQKEDANNFLRHYKTYQSIKDSLNNDLSNIKITEMQEKYENEEQKKEITSLKKEKEIQEIELQKEKEQKKFLVIGLMIFGVMAGLVFKLYQVRAKAHNVLTKQHNLITQKNKELYDLNEQLLESQTQLKHLNQTKDKLFSIISHDVRGPIASLSSFLHLIIDYADVFKPEELQNVAKDIQKSLFSVSEFLNNLLKWSQAQLNTIEVKTTQIDVHKMVDDALEIAIMSAQSKGISLKKEGEMLPCFALADLNMMEFVLRNILMNAIKFSHSNSEILVTIAVENSYVCLNVTDYGIGMSPQQLEKIFDLESRTIRKGTNKEQGVGLGLLLCKEFMEKNKGKLHIESKENEGTKISLRLPRYRLIANTINEDESLIN